MELRTKKPTNRWNASRCCTCTLGGFKRAQPECLSPLGRNNNGEALGYTASFWGGDDQAREAGARRARRCSPTRHTCVSFGKCTINQSSSSIEHLHTAPTVVRGQPLTSAPSAIAHHRRHVDASLGSVPPPAVTTASLQHPSVRAPLLARPSRPSASSVIVLRLRRRASTSPPCPGAAATASVTAAVGRASGVDGGGGGASKCSVPTASMMRTIALRMVLGAGETRGGGGRGGGKVGT